MSKIKVKHYLLLQAVLSLVLPVFYMLSFSVSHGEGVMSVRVGFNAWVFFAVIFVALLAAWFLRINREKYDEYAKRALQIADAVCFKAALVFICGFLALMFGLTVFRMEPVTGAAIISLGKVLVFAISGLFILRFVLFYVIDKKGMVQ